MRVLTKGLDKELTKLLKDQKVSKVDIATAWATEGCGLDALEEHKGRREQRNSKMIVRSIVGFSGNHTTPSALKRLAELGEVRLLGGHNRMFHVKLFLFRSSSGSVAWVGSANFTGRGFGSNEELLYETKVTAKLQEWFDERWEEIGAQPGQLDEYCKGWKKPPPMRGVDDDGEDRGQPAASSRDVNFDKAEAIVFVQEGTRPPPAISGGNGKRHPPRGKVEIGEHSYDYASAQNCLKVVLEALQRRDPSFLQRCSANPKFRGTKLHYIARGEAFGSPAADEWPNEICDGWSFTTNTQTRQKWNMICAAAKIAGLEVKVRRVSKTGRRVNGKKWKAEAKAKEKVGF